MLRNYFKIALRHLRKNKLYAFVNIVGLTIGVASCILIGLYIWSEESFDRFHENAGRIARVTWEYRFEDKPQKVALTGTKVGPEFKRNFPEVEAYVRTLKHARVIQFGDQSFDEKNFLYADSAFFKTFSFPLKEGDPSKVLDAPDQLVITEKLAQKYFGNGEPVGKTLKVGGKDFLITGVAADIPDNSQVQFDLVGTFASLSAAKVEKWYEANDVTYLLLRKNTSLQSLQSKIDRYCATILKHDMKLAGTSYSKYNLEPITRVHLHSDLEGFEPNGNIVYILVLGAVAILILLVAGVNYTNLNMAQSTGRSAEVGMRKVLGARRTQLFYQFISESLVLTFLSIIVAVGLCLLLLPLFNEITGKHLLSTVFYQPVFLCAVLILGCILALVSGFYPSVILSGGSIIRILKSGFHFTGSGQLRRSLIVFQFVISTFLIVSTVIIHRQLSFIRNKDLGYSKEQVLVLPVDNTILEHYDDIKQAFAANPNIKSIGGAYEEPISIGWSDGINKGSTSSETGQISVRAIPVDEDFTKALGLKIIAGSDFNQTDVKQFDTSNGGRNLHYSYILNEAAVKALGWTPAEAIGQTVTKGNSGIVRGVVKDFHFRSLHEPIGPLAIFLDKRMIGSMFVKISGNVSATLAFLEQTWKQRITHRPFEYHFLDESYNTLYIAEQKTANVFSAFALIAIALACMGLLALTAYAMVQRTKEIGIRKILGATVADILALVSKDFLKLVVVALIIAIPIAWYTGNKWLGNFAYRTSIHWWLFALAGLVILLIAFMTTSLQALKTATANPVENLRTE